MKCWVYRGRKQPDAYLFVPRPDDFDAVPRELLDRLGRLDLAMELELTPDRSLARSNPDAVRAALAEPGYFFQPPPPKEPPLMPNTRF
jgi:hypothetical protein